ncbi:MAG TPA: ABC transporter permease [Vicinamibacterales bacterium]|nr:ABC transporter permease [Vicinamibacterales bacterium]
MKTIRAFMTRLFGVFGSARSERELSAEIESHLQLHVDDNIRAGMTPVEAKRRAVIALGGVEGTKEAYRDRRGLPAFESLVRDVRYGIRTLIKSPGFAIAGIVILGLGIGVNTAIFTVVNAVVLKPLPFADADRIVRLWHTPPQSTFAGMEVFALSPANFIDWEAQSEVFERMAIYRGGRWTLTGQGDPDAVVVSRGSADLLPILGITPTIGRGFTKDDDNLNGPRNALLGNAFWRTRFGGDQSVIGRTITLDRRPYTVIGIVPDVPALLENVQVFVPLSWTAKERATRANHNYRGIAKLKPGIDIARANADLTAISKRLEAQYPEDNKDWGALVRPLQDDLVGDVRSSLMVLLGAVALVLLIACANLANLMLVRTHGRAKEIAVRGALGASRVRVIQQLLAEGVVLGIGGGLVGFAAAYFGVDVLKAAFGTALPRANEIAVDTQVLGFTAAIAVAAGVVAAFAPAWQLTGRDANDALKMGPGRGNSSSGDGKIRNLLVVSEVALALMLLIGAGLLMRSLTTLRGVDPGFDAANTWTASLDIPEAKYGTPEVRNQFFDRVIENVRALPGVQSAAWIDTIPLDGGGSTQYVVVEGQPPMKDSELPVVAVRLPSPGYFATSKIPFVSGRDFSVADGFGKPRVVIISEKTAERFFPGRDPIGRHITLKMMTPEPAEIIGVVREVKLGGLDATASNSETAVYAPAAQFGYNGSTLVVRTAGEPASLTRSVINAVRTLDPEQPVLNIQTMEQVVEQSLGQRPLAMLLLAAFAALALLLATVGIYSVLAYTVRQRVREIGIRMALGAPVRGLLKMIVIEGLKPTVIGVVLGLVMAAALVRVMETLLFGVSQYDPGTFSVVALLMLAVGIVATLLPAYRATRVDPIVTLRAE